MFGCCDTRRVWIRKGAAWLFRLSVCLIALPGLAAETAAPAPRKAADWIRRQTPAQVWPEVEPLIASEKVELVVSISAQRLWFLVGEKVYIDSPVSTGKRTGMTPLGQYKVLEKDPDHHSNLYGAFVDGAGRVVRDGVSARLDSAPSGTRFRGSPMKWFLRLTDGGIGLHVGNLPGYPASHGCVRLPEPIAERIFRSVKLGTPVSIVP
ncbi:MAG: hypothetical protein RLZZ253_1674 [Verrucomicrobiota bacterium]